MLALRSRLFSSSASHRETMDQVDTQIIAEAVFAELEFQFREVEEYKRKRQRMENEIQGRPDYSWLIDSKPGYKIPQNIRLEIEQQCRSIDKDQIAFIVREFRSLIVDDSTPELVCGYMRFVLDQHVGEQMAFQSAHRKPGKNSVVLSNSFAYDETPVCAGSATPYSEEGLRSVSYTSFRPPTGRHSAFVTRSHSAPLRAWKLLRKGRVVPTVAWSAGCSAHENELASSILDEDQAGITAARREPGNGSVV